MNTQQYVVVVPVKAPAIGKSRLLVPDHARPGLATAFALDVLAAVREVDSVCEVVVMTADTGFARECDGLGARVVPDGRDLNQGLRAAAGTVGGRHPEAVPVALCADLPCLRADDLTTALEQVAGNGAWFCADAEGTGTTLYTAPYAAFHPRFGQGSRRAHEQAGTRPLAGVLATLRRDVDDEAALAEAMRLGTGRHTRAALADLVP